MTRHHVLASLIAFSVPLFLVAESGCNVGGGHCSGDIMSCSRFEAFECAGHDGCHVEEACFVGDCSVWPSQTSCQANAACVWGAAGCQAAEHDACADLQQAECGALAGCEWGDVCKGKGIDCYDFDSKGSCNAKPGCSWDEAHTF